MAQTYSRADKEYFAEELFPKTGDNQHAIRMIMKNGKKNPNGLKKPWCIRWLQRKGEAPDVAMVDDQDNVTFERTKSKHDTRWTQKIPGATDFVNKYMAKKYGEKSK
ncbi:MAG: hypothetical protein Q9162_001458 [Coniocarpon cinnabarinum]